MRNAKISHKKAIYEGRIAALVDTIVNRVTNW